MGWIGWRGNGGDGHIRTELTLKNQSKINKQQVRPRNTLAFTFNIYEITFVCYFRKHISQHHKQFIVKKKEGLLNPLFCLLTYRYFSSNPPTFTFKRI